MLSFLFTQLFLRIFFPDVRFLLLLNNNFLPFASNRLAETEAKVRKRITEFRHNVIPILLHAPDSFSSLTSASAFYHAHIARRGVHRQTDASP